MKRILVSACIVLGMALSVYGAPLPPVTAVNHQTKECSHFFAGDECMDCSPPEGWIVVGPGQKGTCPGGYRETKVRAVCTPFEAPFCCTKGHSGAPGNCTNVVVNNGEKKCAFVRDIGKCSSLPRGWVKPPVDDPVCPSFTYKWIKTHLECPAGTEKPAIR